MHLYYGLVIVEISYLLEVIPPQQASSGLYDLEISVDGREGYEEDAILYTDVGGYTISGVVRDTVSNPIEGVRISIGDKFAFTNASGEFSIEDLPDGVYNVVPTKTGYTFSNTGMDIAVPPNRTVNFTGTSFSSDDTFHYFASSDVTVREKYPDEAQNTNCINAGYQYYSGYKEVISMLRFSELTTAPELDGAAVYNATLHLHVGEIDTDTRLRLWQIGNGDYAWSESSTYSDFDFENPTWYYYSSMPSSIGFDVETSDEGDWLEIASSLKEAVQGIIDGYDVNYGFLIDGAYSSVNSYPCFSSSESSNPPRLEIQILTGTPDLVVSDVHTAPGPDTGNTYYVGDTINIHFTNL